MFVDIFVTCIKFYVHSYNQHQIINYILIVFDSLVIVHYTQTLLS
jgi:hypothetical protein